MLDGIPELTPQTFCSIRQSTSNKFFGRRLDLFLQFLADWCFYLDFFDTFTSFRTRNRTAKAVLFSLPYAASSVRSAGRVDISL